MTDMNEFTNKDHIRNAEQFLEDLNNATIEKLFFETKCKDHYETPDWLQERYNQAMQNLGRWLMHPAPLTPPVKTKS